MSNNPGKLLNQMRNKKLTPEQRSEIARKAYLGTKRAQAKKKKPKK